MDYVDLHISAPVDITRSFGPLEMFRTLLTVFAFQNFRSSSADEEDGLAAVLSDLLLDFEA
jgi:hypothetical protein